MKSDIFVAPLFCDKMFHKSLYLEISPVNVLFVPSSKNKEGMGTELRKGKKSVNLWSSIMKWIVIKNSPESLDEWLESLCFIAYVLFRSNQSSSIGVGECMCKRRH